MKLPRFAFSNDWNYRLARHIVFWLAVIIFLRFEQITRVGTDTLEGVLNNFGFMLKFDTSVTLMGTAPFCYVVIYVLTPRYLLNKKYFLFVLAIIFTIIVGQAFIDLFILAFPFPYPMHPPDDIYLFIWTSSIRYLSDACVLPCAVLLSLKLFKTWYLKQAEGLLLAKANAEAEMQILKAQVQPHFLFNTLNNIYSFTLNKSPKAITLVDNLYNIMQYMVNDCNVELIELSRDLQMIQDYIELEKVRYGKRLHISVNIEGDYQNKMIAPLLIIPFVENSFKHGASKMLAEPWIELTIEVEENTLYFSLENSKPDKEITTNDKKGIGLQNVKKRLELLYPSKHYLQIELTNDTFTVAMQLPLQEKRANNRMIETPTTVHI